MIPQRPHRSRALAALLALAPPVPCTDLLPSDVRHVLEHPTDAARTPAPPVTRAAQSRADHDLDGLPDHVEDRDNDGVQDPGETSPDRADTDGDGLSDGHEDRNRNGRRDPGESSPTQRCTDATSRGRPCATREDQDGEHRGPRLPEPMVVDLIRGLGARRGEFEVNALALLAPSARGLELRWAPEVEYAFRDDWAVEVELPMRGSHLEALKVALQWTFGVAARERFIHGTQLIAEVSADTGAPSATLFYLAGFRFTEALSVFAMSGAQYAHTGNGGTEGRVVALFHPSVFVEFSPRVLLGVETNLAWSPAAGSLEVRVTPQVRWRFADHWVVQLGAGAEAHTPAVVRPFVGLRLSGEL